MALSRPLRLHRRFVRLDHEGDLARFRRSSAGREVPVAAPRLRRLPRRTVIGHEIPVAVGFRARLLGLALLDRAAAGPGLLIPRCAAVHTFGMRFDLDVYFLDADGSILATHRAVPPRRFVAHRGATTVLEVPASPSGS
jgi:uncharacterized membrane protein (UPF0127 family)